MNYINFKSEYDKCPETSVEGFDTEAFSGWRDIVRQLNKKVENALVVDCYPGVLTRSFSHISGNVLILI